MKKKKRSTKSRAVRAWIRAAGEGSEVFTPLMAVGMMIEDNPCRPNRPRDGLKFLREVLAILKQVEAEELRGK